MLVGTGTLQTAPTGGDSGALQLKVPWSPSESSPILRLNWKIEEILLNWSLIFYQVLLKMRLQSRSLLLPEVIKSLVTSEWPASRQTHASVSLSLSAPRSWNERVRKGFVNIQ